MPLVRSDPELCAVLERHAQLLMDQLPPLPDLAIANEASSLNNGCPVQVFRRLNEIPAATGNDDHVEYLFVVVRQIGSRARSFEPVWEWPRREQVQSAARDAARSRAGALRPRLTSSSSFDLSCRATSSCSSYKFFVSPGSTSRLYSAGGSCVCGDLDP